MNLSRSRTWVAIAIASFALNFAWEMMQAPLYSSMAGLRWYEATRLCAWASLGDVGISLASYAGASALAGTSSWLSRPRVEYVMGFVAIGLALALSLELVNVHVLDRWSYGPLMPRVLGLGLAPLAQWLLVPPVTLWLARLFLIRGAGGNRTRE